MFMESIYIITYLFCFAVDLSPMFPDTLMVGMEIRLKVGLKGVFLIIIKN